MSVQVSMVCDISDVRCLQTSWLQTFHVDRHADKQQRSTALNHCCCSENKVDMVQLNLSCRDAEFVPDQGIRSQTVASLLRSS